MTLPACVQVTLVNQLTSTSNLDSAALSSPLGSANPLFRFDVTDEQVQTLDNSPSSALPFLTKEFTQNGIQLTSPTVTVGTPASSWTVTSGQIKYALSIAGNTISVTSPAFPASAPSASLTVGLHAPEVSYNIRMADGVNVGADLDVSLGCERDRL